MNSAKLIEDDFVEQIFVASTHDIIMFITSAGKAYWMKVHEIPEASRTARGAHIKALLAVSPNEDITAVVALKDFSDENYLFMGTARGVVKKVKTSDFVHAKTRGIIAINLDEGDRLVSALLTKGADEVVLISRKGQALRAAEAQVRTMGRASRGVWGIRMDSDDELTGVLRVDNSERMLVLSEYGYGKRVEFSEFTPHGRGTGGQKIYTISEKTGDIVGCVNVSDGDEIMCITSQGKSIKLLSDEVNVFGRSAQGVRVVNIDRPDFVIGVDRVAREEEPELVEGSGEVSPVVTDGDIPEGDGLRAEKEEADDVKSDDAATDDDEDLT